MVTRSSWSGRYTDQPDRSVRPTGVDETSHAAAAHPERYGRR